MGSEEFDSVASALAGELDAVRGTLGRLRRWRDKTRDELRSTRAELTAEKAAHEAARRERRVWRDRTDDKVRELNRELSDHNATKSELEKARAALAETQALLEANNRAALSWRDELERREQQHNKVLAERDELGARLGRLEAELAALRKPLTVKPELAGCPPELSASRILDNAGRLALEWTEERAKLRAELHEMTTACIAWRETAEALRKPPEGELLRRTWRNLSEVDRNRVFYDHPVLFESIEAALQAKGEPEQPCYPTEYLAQFERAWARMPEQRFGQLICNAILPGSGAATAPLYYVRDSELLSKVEAFAKADAEPPAEAPEPRACAHCKHTERSHGSDPTYGEFCRQCSCEGFLVSDPEPAAPAPLPEPSK